jgi:type IV pilus assembly protein PilC
MPVFAWEGRTRGGDVRRGEIEAATLNDAEQRVSSQQIIISKIQKRGFELKMPTFGTGVATRDLVIFTRQFATMIDAGLPIVQALDLLQAQEPNLRFKKVLREIKTSVESGMTLAESMGKHPAVFDSLFVNLVAAGESGGVLDGILNRLAVYIEKAAQLQRKVKGAMTYPAIVLGIAILLIIVMLWKVIPTFEEMFSNFGNAELPAPTRFVIGLSHRFFDFAPLLMLAGVGLFFGVSYLMKTHKTRRVIDRWALKMPALGPVLRKAAVARFTRTFGTMMASGVPILDALDIVSKSAGNKRIEEALVFVREKVSEGKTLVEPLLETGIFPEMVVQMMGVGEATGALDVMLNKIADFYEEEVDLAVDGLTALIEPIMMVFIGGIVAGLLLAMYLPIFSLAETVNKK